MSHVLKTISIRGEEGPIVDFTLTDSVVKSETTTEFNMVDLSNDTSEEDCTQEQKCGNCYKSFRRFSELEKHLNLCHLNTGFHLPNIEMMTNIEKIEEDAVNMERDNICFCCGESYDTFHLGPIKCSGCTKSFKTSISYERHIFITHSESDAFPCTTCNAKLRTVNLLKLHEKQHERYGENRVVCDFCEKKFPSLSALKDHRRSHTGEKPYSCTECNRSFSVKESLNRHMRRHTGEKPFTCTECNQSFSHMNTLKCHMTRHTGTKLFACTECNKSFAVKHALKYHMRRHTGEKPYLCNQCNQTFALKHALTRHMKTHTGERPYKCNECNQSFTAKRSLHDHMTRHTGEKPHKCTECNKSFSIKSSLYHHMKRHAAEKPHVCKDCGKRFIRALNLDYHSKTHARPFACDQCKEKFKTNKELKKHIRIHSSKSKDKNESQEHKFKCKECKTMYATKEELKTHYNMEVHKTKHNTKKQKGSVTRHKEFTSIKKDSETNRSTKNSPKLELNNSVSSLTKIYRLDDLNELPIKNVSTNNNIMSPTKYSSMEDKVISHFSKDEEMPRNVLTIENKSIETEPTVIIPHNLVGAITKNEILFENDTPKQEFIEEAVNERSTVVREYSTIIIDNETTKIELRATIPDTLIDPVINDCAIFDDGVDEKEYKKNELSEGSTENLFLGIEQYSVITIENETIKKEPEISILETETSTVINDGPTIEGDSDPQKLIANNLTETTTQNLLINNELPALKVPKNMQKEKQLIACDFCEKKFPNMSSLKNHRVSHTGEKPYTCTECNKKFAVKHALKYHMMLHTGEKPYTCTECNKSFAIKHALKFHMRRHTGEKPHVCTECNRSFTVKHALKRHMKIHTGVGLYECTEYFETRLENLRQKWDAFEDNNDNLMKNLKPDHEYITKNYYGQLQQRRNEIENRFNNELEIIRQIEQKEAQVSRHQVIRGQEEALSLRNQDISINDEVTITGPCDITNKRLAILSTSLLQIKETIDLTKSIETLQFKLEKLKNCWAKISQLNDESLFNNDEIDQGDFIQLESIYEEVYIQLQEELNVRSQNVSETRTTELFDRLVQQSHNLVDVERMQYLKGSLRGEAARLINHLTITANNYTAAVELLKQRYNNPAILVDNLINKLLSLRAIRNENAQDLKTVVDSSREVLYGIRNLNVDTSSWDPLIIQILLPKLDGETRKLYQHSRGASTQIPKLSSLYEFIESRNSRQENGRILQLADPWYAEPKEIQCTNTIQSRRKAL
ncbi:zinc finger protein 729-like [Teleopsis dalmanni]|uniref:zinc finger protein 729-like n=1 Tax=Teleopsis dalmanni TaxID=139649 RepID=UPI0018CCD85E|nr:zinc finger protein 729-like [Teleopsis dalmanni]